MQDPASCHVPPGSTPLRELARAVGQALTLPGPATTRDEVTYLRITRDRARLVRQVMRRLADDCEVGQIGDDTYDHEPARS